MDTVKGTFIQFVDEGIPSGMKTHIFRVESADPVEVTMILGTVKWYGQWRKYCFMPNGQTVYEQTCLREIADFCENMTTMHWTTASKSLLRTPVTVYVGKGPIPNRSPRGGA